MAIVLDDDSVDCVTITFCAGQQLIPLYPMVVDMFKKLIKGSSKTVNIWLYGTSLPATEELSRQLQSQGLPVYFDLDTAIKPLGYASYYAEVKTAFDEE